MIPGFVDAHTHLVFAGDRADEFALKMSGATYAEVAAAGGGIVSTVRATREASEDELFREAAARAWRMIAGGTTALEIKSGYGLDLETEMRLLRVARRIGDELPLTVKTTFLGAHAIPPEHRGDREGYLDLIVEEMLPAVAAERLAEIGDFLALGLIRLRSRQSSQKTGHCGDSSLDCDGTRSGHAQPSSSGELRP